MSDRLDNTQKKRVPPASRRVPDLPNQPFKNAMNPAWLLDACTEENVISNRSAANTLADFVHRSEHGAGALVKAAIKAAIYRVLIAGLTSRPARTACQSDLPGSPCQPETTFAMFADPAR